MASLDDILEVLKRMEKKQDVKTSKEEKEKKEKKKPDPKNPYEKALQSLASLKIPGISNLAAALQKIIDTVKAVQTIHDFVSPNMNKDTFLKAADAAGFGKQTKSDAASKIASQFGKSSKTSGTSGMSGVAEGVGAGAGVAEGAAEGAEAGAGVAEAAAEGIAGLAAEALAAATIIGLVVVAVIELVKMFNNAVKAVKDFIGIFSDIKAAAQGRGFDFVENLGSRLGDRAESFFTHAFGAMIPFFGEAIGSFVGGIAKTAIQLAILPFTIKNFAESILNLNTQFAEMSGPMSVVAAKWEVFSTLLSGRIGDVLAPSASKLEESLEKLFETLAPYLVTLIIIITDITTIVVEFTIKAIEFMEAVIDILPGFGGVVHILREMRELLKENGGSESGIALSNAALQYNAFPRRPVVGFGTPNG